MALSEAAKRAEVREAAARLAETALAEVLKRHGPTAETLATAAEGFILGLARALWENATDKSRSGKRWLRRALELMAEKASDEVAR